MKNLKSIFQIMKNQRTALYKCHLYKIITLFIVLIFNSGMQSQNCQKFLNDFAPAPSDSVLYVKLNFIVFKPSGATGVWDHNTIDSAQKVIDYVNSVYSTLYAPHLQDSGGAYIPDSKIRFVINSFSYVTNSSFYANLEIAKYSYYTPNAINVFFGSAQVGLTGPNSDFNFNTVFFPTAAPLGDPNANMCFPNNEVTVVHELAHAMGLVDESANNNFIKLSSPCCDTIYTNDVVIESMSVFYTVGNCGTPPLPYSNNILGNNNPCRRYLSPQQLGILHYYLRTKNKGLLKPNSYIHAMNVNTASDYVLTSDETWTKVRYLKGNIRVPAGKTLTIKCLVAMTENATIIIDPGAKLLIDGGEITNISGHLWGGIHLGGSAAQSQVLNGNGSYTYQGFLKMINGATLSHAENAVKVYLVDSTSQIRWGTTGGVIQALDANFLNNVRDVEFLYYNKSSASRFYNCKFKTTGTIGRTSNNTMNAPFAHITLYGINGVKIYGCEFEYAAGNTFTNHGLGILSCDAVFTIGRYGGADSKFKKFRKAIQVENGIPFTSVDIHESSFIDNVEDAIYLHNTNHSVIENNNIQAKAGVGIITSGIYLNTNQNYVVKNNDISESPASRATTGVYAFNSLAGSHEIFRNSFSGCQIGISAVDNNSGQSNLSDGLRMNCNDFSQAYNKFDITLTSSGLTSDLPTVMTRQGAVALQASGNLVRNIYAAPCGNQNKWYVASNSTKPIDHGCNSDAATQPLPQPGCSRAIVNVLAAPFPLDYVAHCPVYLPSGGGSGTNSTQRMSNINKHLEELFSVTPVEQDYFEIEATLSGKLNLFLNDSLPGSKDSILVTLANNQGSMADADLQLVFAYMHKGDLSGALSRVNALDTVSRGGWKTFLVELIDMYQDSAGVYSLKTDTVKRRFMEDYVSAGKDGHHIAQAILKFAVGAPYTEPRPLPDEGKEESARLMQPQVAKEGVQENIPAISVYPNPASETVTFAYKSAGGHDLQVTLTDALGRRFYATMVKPGSVTELSLSGLPNGLYILNAYDQKTSVYQVRVICIK